MKLVSPFVLPAVRAVSLGDRSLNQYPDRCRYHVDVSQTSPSFSVDIPTNNQWTGYEDNTVVL
jgi:hypothetical protein